MKNHSKTSCNCLYADKSSTHKTKCYHYTPFRLAQTSIPIQTFTQTYSLKDSWIKGTLFPELYSPYKI